MDKWTTYLMTFLGWLLIVYGSWLNFLTICFVELFLAWMIGLDGGKLLISPSHFGNIDWESICLKLSIAFGSLWWVFGSESEWSSHWITSLILFIFIIIEAFSCQSALKVSITALSTLSGTWLSIGSSLSHCLRWFYLECIWRWRCLRVPLFEHDCLLCELCCLPACSSAVQSVTLLLCFQLILKLKELSLYLILTVARDHLNRAKTLLSYFQLMCFLLWWSPYNLFLFHTLRLVVNALIHASSVLHSNALGLVAWHHSGCLQVQRISWCISQCDLTGHSGWMLTLHERHSLIIIHDGVICCQLVWSQLESPLLVLPLFIHESLCNHVLSEC